MRKTGLWWTGLIIGALGAVWAASPVPGAWKYLGAGDRFLSAGLALLPFASIMLGWGKPRMAGLLLVAQVLLTWTWGAVQIVKVVSNAGHFEPFAVFTGISWSLPLLVSGVLFILSSSRTAHT